MRKLLLATVAALGASMVVAASADAQIVDNTDGQSFPTPGQITVRLNGRFRFYAYADGNDATRTSDYGISQAAGGTGVGYVGNPGSNVTAGSGTTLGALAATSSNQGINKVSNYGFTEYARLYPGFDGVAANGLKYGASLEIRQDGNFGAGGGTYGSTTGQTRTRGLLYFRRSFGYIGTDRLGTVRVGSTDQPTSLYLTGNFENFDDGGLNGDLGGVLPNAGVFNWPFNDVGNLYTTTKIVYLSPQFYGVDFGLSFEPSTAGIGGDNGEGCGPSPQFGNFNGSGIGAASPGCDALSSTDTADYLRRKNTYEGLVRYRGTFGPVGIAATASYDGSARVRDSGIPSYLPGSAANPQHQRVEDLSYGDFGLVATFGGLSVGGNYQVGRYTVGGGGGAGALLNRGQPNSSAFVVGASYTIGPVIFGAHYVRSFYEGDRVTATNRNQISGALVGGFITGGQRLDQGAAAGATYSLAPGVSLYLSYIWEQARQNGFNLLTGATNVSSTSTSATPNLHNKLSQNVLAIGTSFAW